ncbi:ThiF family [Burkholderia pseudomallei]|nr:ThiF family [Burkholderia pseudomallei]
MSSAVPQSVLDVIGLLQRHRAVTRVNSPVQVEGGLYQVTVEVAVELPSRAKASGRSSTGVLAREVVIFEFGDGWPISAPRIGLRKDFPRNLPHINPYTEEDYVRPCVYAGSLSELMHREGFDALVDQTVEWLCKAAANNLISATQGWEPTRRDGACGTIVFDADRMADLLPRVGGFVRLPSTFRGINGHRHFVVDLNPDANKRVWYQVREHNDQFGVWTEGQTCAFLAGPSVDQATHAFPVYGVYEPETVKSFDDLRARADHFGIDGEGLLKILNAFFDGSQKSGKTFSWPSGFNAVVILAVHRPLPLISSYGRSVELLPYVVQHDPLPSKKSLNFAKVELALHQQGVTPKVLREVSGTPNDAAERPMVWLGLGSLGSKVALHMVKAGFGNHLFVDNDVLSPHNIARHGLMDVPDRILLPMKSYMMASAAFELGHTQSRALYEDALVLLKSSERFEQTVSEKSLIVDATASLGVLEAACTSALLAEFDGRYARTAMLGNGRVCYLALEGPARGTRVDDLMALLFDRCRADSTLREAINQGTRGVDHLFVGQNCSSSTTIMPDSIISRGAASVAVQLQRWLERGLPDQGTLLLGVEDAAALGLSWSVSTTEPTLVLHAESDGGWEIRVLSEVVRAIEHDVENWRPNETGGALLGHIYPGRRCIVIGGLVDAPPDSKRTPTRFTLGIEGLEESLRQAHKGSLGHLHFVGTWHSHPSGGGHSSIDLRTLGNLATGAEGLPAVSLVWTPTGFLCEVMTIA